MYVRFSFLFFFFFSCAQPTVTTNSRSRETRPVDADIRVFRSHHHLDEQEIPALHLHHVPPVDVGLPSLLV